MKILKKLFVLFLLLNIISFSQVYAEVPNCGSITGNYSYDNENLKDALVSIYLIANYDEATKSYTYVNEFKEFELDINSLNYGELEEYSITLKKHINSEKIKSVESIKTNEDGDFKFNNCLDRGLYIITVEDLKINNNIYEALPSILTVPTFSKVDGTEIYDIKINVKSEMREDNTTDYNPDDDENDSTIKIPNTYDAIINYILLLVVSLVLLVILVCYIYYKKKGSKENEKKI